MNLISFYPYEFNEFNEFGLPIDLATRSTNEFSTNLGSSPCGNRLTTGPFGLGRIHFTAS